MDWGSIVLVVEILLLVAGWLLFQQAKTELTARAVQIPVLSEVKALQKSVVALLEQLKLESTQVSAQLEARCREARDLLAALDRRLEEIQQTPPRAAVRRREKITAEPTNARAGHTAIPPRTETIPPPTLNPRYQEVYALADSGLPLSAIAQQTGLSEGEVELLLGLRPQPS